MAGHSTLGPSKAKQWINCPGSIALCEKAPAPKPSRAAAEGTVAHKIAEEFVTGKIDSLEMMALIGVVRKQDGFDIEITEEMYDGAVEYKELIDADRKALGATSGSAPVTGAAEVRVHADDVDDRVWGTADYLLYKPGKKLIAYDYKFGSGVIVDPDENEQAGLYLLGAMRKLGMAFDELEIVIHQPRGRHIDGPVRRWTADKRWLDAFREIAKAAAAETLSPTARVVAGDWCRWCAAKPFCPVVHKAAEEAAMTVFSAVAPAAAVDKTVDMERVKLLPLEQLGKMLEWEGAVKSLFDAVKDVVKERLSNGLPVPGWKLVDGREGNREWIDEDAVVAEFAPVLGAEALFTKKLLSPAKLEKLAGKKHKIDHLVTRAPGEKAIARDRDPRPQVASAAQDAFTVTAEDDLMLQLNGGDGGGIEKVWP